MRLDGNSPSDLSRARHVHEESSRKPLGRRTSCRGCFWALDSAFPRAIDEPDEVRFEPINPAPLVIDWGPRLGTVQ